MEIIRTTLFLPRKYHESLKKLAFDQKTSMAQLVQKALEEVFFKRNKKTAKDLFGSVSNTQISEEEFSQLKRSLNPKK